MKTNTNEGMLKLCAAVLAGTKARGMEGRSECGARLDWEMVQIEKTAKDAAVLLWEQLKRERWAMRMKAHCVGQVELAMRLAYLKVHYAKEWEGAKERQCKKIEDERVRREDDFLSECE